MTNEPPRPGKLPPDASAGTDGNVVAKTQSPPSVEAATAPDQPVPANSLTPEEQMALFEKELKEKDWGHQPC